MQSDESTQATTETHKKPRYFYGWNIVFAAFMARLAYAEHYSATLGLFFKPFTREFGWSRTAISAVITISRLVESVIAPFVGPLIDRYGPRVMMPIGGIIVGFVMLAVTQMTNVWHLYLLRGVAVAIGYTLMGQLVSNTAISNWFVRKRGRAIAIAAMGSNLGNLVMTPTVIWLIVTYGWRGGFVFFAILTWAVVLLPSAILMRRRPEDMGLRPDGMESPAADMASPLEGGQESPANVAAPTLEPVWTRREVLATSTFWMLAISLSIESLGFQGINISLAPYIQDLGYSATMMAAVVTFRPALMMVSLPVMGFVAESAHRVPNRVMPFVLLGLSSFLFLLAEEPAFLWLAVAVYGVGTTGLMVIQEVLWANYFGRLNLGMVRSTAMLVIFGFGAIGPIFMNVVFDTLGSYRPAYILFIGLFAVSAFLIGACPHPKARHHTTVEGISSSPKETSP